MMSLRSTKLLIPHTQFFFYVVAYSNNIFVALVPHLFVKEQTPIEEEDAGEDAADEEEEIVVCYYSIT